MYALTGSAGQQYRQGQQAYVKILYVMYYVEMDDIVDVGLECKGDLSTPSTGLEAVKYCRQLKICRSQLMQWNGFSRLHRLSNVFLSLLCSIAYHDKSSLQCAVLLLQCLPVSDVQKYPGFQDGHILSPLSITATRANRRCLRVHVCVRWSIALSSPRHNMSSSSKKMQLADWLSLSVYMLISDCAFRRSGRVTLMPPMVHQICSIQVGPSDFGLSGPKLSQSTRHILKSTVLQPDTHVDWVT